VSLFLLGLLPHIRRDLSIPEHLVDPVRLHGDVVGDVVAVVVMMVQEVVLLHLEDLLEVWVKPQNTHLHRLGIISIVMMMRMREIQFPIPRSKPSRPPGLHFGNPLLRGTMETAVEFFKLFFTAQMVNEIVDHTNSYDVEYITEGPHRTYAQPDGSWKDTTADEIYRLIALLI